VQTVEEYRREHSEYHPDDLAGHDPYNYHGIYVHAPQAGLVFREYNTSDLTWVLEDGSGFTFKHKLILGPFAFLFGRRVS